MGLTYFWSSRKKNKIWVVYRVIALFLGNTLYFRTKRFFFRAILSAILIKLGLSFQKIVLEWFFDNWLRCHNGSKLQEDKILKNRNFSVFWNTKISEISESENFGT